MASPEQLSVAHYEDSPPASRTRLRMRQQQRTSAMSVPRQPELTQDDLDASEVQELGREIDDILMFSDELVSGAKFIRDDKAPPMASASPLPGDSWLSAEYHQKDLDQCKAEIKALQESAANEISAMCNPEPLEACTGRLQALQQEKDAGHCAVEQLRLCMEELVMLKGNVQDLHLNMSAISGDRDNFGTDLHKIMTSASEMIRSGKEQIDGAQERLARLSTEHQNAVSGLEACLKGRLGSENELQGVRLALTKLEHRASLLQATGASLGEVLSDVARICKRLAKNAKELVHSAHGSLIEFQDLLIISLVDLAAPHLAALRPWAELLPRQLWAACCCILDAIQLALGSLDLSSLEALGRNNQLLLSLAAAVTAGLVCVLVVLRVGKAFRAPPTEEGADAQHDQGVSAPDTPPAVGHPLISRTPNEVFSDTHVAPQAEASPTSTYLKSQEATPIATGMMQSSAPQASRERIKKLNARCRELEEDNERLRGQVQEQEARIKETIDGRWAQAYAESLKLKASTPARVSAVNMQSRHSTPAFEAGGASPDTETAADMHHSPVQVRQLWEEVSRLRTSESRATQQAAQLRLQLDLLEAQKGGADSIESQQLQAKVARLRERNAELEAQLQGRFVPIQPSTNDEAAQALTKEAAEAEARRQQGRIAELEAELVALEEKYSLEVTAHQAAVAQVVHVEERLADLADSAANDVTNHLHFAELQSRVAELTRQLDVASTSRHGVQEEMQREILDLQSINSALKESCTTSEEREKMLQDKLSQMEAESRKSMEQGAAAFLVAQDSEHLQAQITTLGEQCQRQADEMVEAVAIILQLETDAQHSMEGLRAQEVRVEGMQQELAFLEASVAAKTALVLSLEEQSAAMAAEKSRFLARMEELQAEADRAGLQLHAPEAAERLVVVEAELEARVKEVEELKRQLSLVPVSAQEETNPEAVTGSGARGLQERVEELQAQLEAAEEEKSFEVAAKEALLARLRELEEQQEAALQQRLDAQESREARADQKISELRHQILDLEEQLQASLQRQGGDGEDGGPETGLKNALQRMEKQLEASRESEAQANQELQDRMVAQAELHRELSAYASEIETLREELDTYKACTLELEHNLSCSTKELQIFRQASARSQENSALVVELQAKLMEKEEEWQEFQAEVDEERQFVHKQLLVLSRDSRLLDSIRDGVEELQEAFQIVEDLEGVDSWRQMVAVLETGNPDADEEDVEFPDLVEEAKAEDGDGTLELSRSSADAKGPEPVTSRLTEMEAEMERLVRDLAAARDDRDNVTRELEEVKARFEDWQRAIALPGEAAQSPGGAREVLLKQRTVLVEALKKENTSQQERIEYLEEKGNRSAEENRKLTGDLKAARSDVVHLKSELDRARQFLQRFSSPSVTPIHARRASCSGEDIDPRALQPLQPSNKSPALIPAPQPFPGPRAAAARSSSDPGDSNAAARAPSDHGDEAPALSPISVGIERVAAEALTACLDKAAELSQAGSPSRESSMSSPGTSQAGTPASTLGIDVNAPGHGLGVFVLVALNLFLAHQATDEAQQLAMAFRSILSRYSELDLATKSAVAKLARLSTIVEGHSPQSAPPAMYWSVGSRHLQLRAPGSCPLLEGPRPEPPSPIFSAIPMASLESLSCGSSPVATNKSKAHQDTSSERAGSFPGGFAPSTAFENPSFESGEGFSARTSGAGLMGTDVDNRVPVLEASGHGNR